MAQRYRVADLHPGETEVWTVPLVQGAGSGTAIPLTSVSTLTLTLKNEAGTTINSRSAQNVLNANNVTVHATSGLLTWRIQPLDTTLSGSGVVRDVHAAKFVVTLTDGQVLHVHVDLFITAAGD